MPIKAVFCALTAFAAFTAPQVALAKAKAKVQDQTCPPTSAFTPQLRKLSGYRVFTGPDGDSVVEPLTIDARVIPLFKTGKELAVLDLPKSGPRQPQIFVGPPNVELAMKPAPYKEMFVLLSGSFVFRTAKFSASMKAGSVLLFEDTDAKIGHGATIGPCGYVSLSIAP